MKTKISVNRDIKNELKIFAIRNDMTLIKATNLAIEMFPYLVELYDICKIDIRAGEWKGIMETLCLIKWKFPETFEKFFRADLPHPVDCPHKGISDLS